MFGYPTGLGALLIRRDSARCLRKRYFGGGTISFASTTSFGVEFRDSLEDRFEDGTCNFYAISALLNAFEIDGGLQSDSAMELAERAYRLLTQLKHPNGAPIAVVYGRGWEDHTKRKSQENGTTEEGRELRVVQGPILNFNLLRDEGSFVGFVEVDKMADLFGIQLRTGCHCNLGACAMHLGWDEEMASSIHQSVGKECGDDIDLVDGKPLGTVRISFGRTSSQRDLDTFRRMLECCFVGPLPPSLTRPIIPDHPPHPPLGFGRLTHLFVYPIKSCPPIAPTIWPICSHSGTLLFDRHWAIVSRESVWLSQKHASTLCSILPNIDRNANELVLSDRHQFVAPIRVPLPLQLADLNGENVGNSGRPECLWRHSSCQRQDYGEGVTDWLGAIDPSLDGCTLIVAASGETRKASRNFAQKAHYLLISRASTLELANSLSLPLQSIIERFRPNFVVDFGPNFGPFEEETVEELSIGSVEFKVNGTCQRCQMICIDQQTGEKDPNILVALRNLRNGRRLSFGIYLQRKETKTHSKDFVKREIHVGSGVRVLKWKEPK